MPTYDYNCSKCEHIQEEFHNMIDEPSIVCEKCGTIMKRGISGGLGYKMVKDGTRNMSYSTRFGRSKNDNTPTPAESAMTKAKQQMAENEATKSNTSGDPYAQFR